MTGGGGDSAGGRGPGASRRSSADEALPAAAAREILLAISRAVQQATIYPAGHPAVAVATSPVVDALSRTLARAPRLVLAFTSEHVLVGPDPDTVEPFDAAWLCQRALARGIASLDFTGRPTTSHAEQLIRWIAQGETLAPHAAPPAFGPCQVGTFDYSRARFRDERAVEGPAASASAAWRTIAQVLAGDWDGGDRQVPDHPAELARFVADALERHEGTGAGELSERLADVGAQFGDLPEAVRSSVKGRLVEFVEALTPELRRRAMTASPREPGGKLDVLSALIDRLPRAGVLDIVRQLKFDRGDSAHQFIVLMLQLTNAAASDATVATALGEHCRRAGVAVPTGVADAAGLRALEEVLSKRVDDSADVNPGDYQAALEALSNRRRRQRSETFSSDHHGDPADAEGLSLHLTEIAVRLLLAGAPNDPDAPPCVARVTQALPGLLDARRFDLLAEAADALCGINRGDSAGGLEFFTSTRMTRETVGLLDATVPIPTLQVASLARAGGAVVADALLARLVGRPARETCRRIGALLAELDPRIVTAAASALCARAPGHARDLLSGLVAAGGSPVAAEVGRLLLGDRDAGVRADACRLALGDPASASAGTVVQGGLLDADARVKEVVIDAAERHPSLLTGAAFRGFLSGASTPASAPLQHRVIRALARLASPAAHDVLRDALGRRGARCSRLGRDVSRAIAQALGRTGVPAAAEAVAGWRRSPAGWVGRLLGERGDGLS